MWQRCAVKCEVSFPFWTVLIDVYSPILINMRMDANGRTVEQFGSGFATFIT